MDDLPPSPDQRSFELLEGRGRYLLTREADGYAIWDARTNVDRPLRTFPLDDDGEGLARAAYHDLMATERLARTFPATLLLIAVASGVAWIGSALALAFLVVEPDRFSRGPDRAFAWAQATEGAAQTLFFVSVGLSLLVWLEWWRRTRGAIEPRSPAADGRGSGSAAP